MAEHIPFGIAQNLLTKLASSTFQEIGLIYSVKNDLRRLENTFVTIKAVLLDAEKKQANSHAVKSWIKRLQDVVYDADDLLDDMATEGLRRKVEGQGRMVRKMGIKFKSVAAIYCKKKETPLLPPRYNYRRMILLSFDYPWDGRTYC